MSAPARVLGAARGGLDRLRGLPRIRRIALAAGAAWIVLASAYAIGFFVVAAGVQTRGMLFLDAMFFLVALVLPLILLGLAAYLAEELERQRAFVAALAELAVPLIEALENMRATLLSHGPASPQDIHRAVQGAMLGGRGPDVSGTLERLLAGQAQLRATLREGLERPAPAASAPQAPTPPPAPAEAETQPDLPLIPPVERSGLDWPDLIRALDFPRDAEDRAGFRALKAALRHHGLAQMLQAAEDVLNLLSQEGVFMDDLAVEPADPDAWRRFIGGARGADVAGVGAIRDAHALGAARELLKSDTIFRDTSLFFQRRFDGVLQDFAQGADDARLRALADTRSGRAFMLLARLGGAFD